MTSSSPAWFPHLDIEDNYACLHGEGEQGSEYQEPSMLLTKKPQWAVASCLHLLGTQGEVWMLDYKPQAGAEWRYFLLVCLFTYLLIGGVSCSPA